MAGIYIHIPFCRKACHYCDFHFSTSLSGIDEMVKAMASELQLKAQLFENEAVETIYFGGGTPSLLSAAQLGVLLETINENYTLNLKEVTLEANPDDISTESLTDWKSLGINRLSIGLQTFHNKTLAWMNRIHSAEEGRNSVKLAQDFGFDNLSLDLIFNIPQSSEKDLQEDIGSLLALDPQHISAYNLNIEPQTVFGKRKKKGELHELDDEQSAQQFLLVRNRLKDSGFDPYEISNFAKLGKEALHNTNYWFQVPYLGIGPSAHGMIGNIRTANVANNALYIRSLKENKLAGTEEILSPADLANEMILTQLRTKWGLNLNELRTKTGIDMVYQHQDNLNSFQNLDLLYFQKDTTYLTDKGILLADYIAMQLMVS